MSALNFSMSGSSVLNYLPKFAEIQIAIIKLKKSYIKINLFSSYVRRKTIESE